jgi:hypothetical protein
VSGFDPPIHTAEDLRVEAVVLDRLLGRNPVGEPVPVELVLTELADKGDVESAMVRLSESGILEVVPDGQIVLSEGAIHFSRVTQYMDRF